MKRFMMILFIVGICSSRITVGYADSSQIQTSEARIYISGKEEINLSGEAIIVDEKIFLPKEEFLTALGVLEKNFDEGQVFYHSTNYIPVNLAAEKFGKEVEYQWSLGQQGIYIWNGSKNSQSLYIIRKDWNDQASEEGIYRDLEMAIKACESFEGYAVYDVQGNLLYPKDKDIENKEGLPILSSPSATLGQAQNWAEERGATAVFIHLAQIYWLLGENIGVDPAVAYAQAAKETNFGRFGGVLDESFQNPCGMKTTEGGGNYDRKAHQSFHSWAEGIQAHLEHLALYAGAPGYPRASSADPRHFEYLAGTAATVEDLSGKWAPSLTYGRDIVEMVKQMQEYAF